MSKQEEINEIKETTLNMCKSTFLWLSLIIIILELIFVVDNVNILQVQNTMQFMGIYIFELMPLSYYLRVRRIEKEYKKKLKREK